MWDTANQPALLFGWGGLPGEPINDINALEAIYFVPEPSSWLIAAVGIALLGGFRDVAGSRPAWNRGHLPVGIGFDV